jgi:serine/threonine protein kinase
MFAKIVLFHLNVIMFQLVVKMSIQLFLALYELHRNHILHRDVKLENIFVGGNGDVKLGDFGFGKLLESSEGKANTFLGTPFLCFMLYELHT